MTGPVLYIVRHEEADDGGPDEHRALTGRGRRRMHATARLAASEIDRLDLVYTSPLVRAVQTAEILVGELGFDEPVRIAQDLAGPTTMERLTRLALDAPATISGIALVGHEPILGALVGHCLGHPIAGVSRGEVYALGFDRASRRFTFRWRIDPSGPTRTDTLER